MPLEVTKRARKPRRMVNTTCAVFNCTSSSHKHKGVKFHQFPKDERLHLWINSCKRPDLIGKDPDQLKNMHICSLHFEQKMYGKLLLKKSAMPTLNLPTTVSNSTYTQTDSCDPAALEILTSQGVQTEDEDFSYALTKAIMNSDLSIYPIINDNESRKMKKRLETRYMNRRIGDSGPITIQQFLEGCDLYLPVSLSNFIKSHIMIQCSD